jgi:hypothetical protein
MNGFVIVTGAGRSGTSAVARVLHESGVRMGRDMAPASEANPEGFYEDLGVVALNERILSDCGLGDPWRAERWPSRARVLAAARPYRDEMAALAREAIDGWKDPRFAITLEAWLPALPQRPTVIVCLRSPRAYAASVTAIYGLVRPARAMREWARHYRRLLAVIRRHRLTATCVEYDALVEQPADAVAALARLVGASLDATYVVPRLRRELAPVPPAYRQLYERVAALGGGPRVRGQGSGAGTSPADRPSRRRETPDYARAFGSLVERLVHEKAAWEAIVRMPAFVLRQGVRATCETYNAQLTEAQGELAALVPPRALVRKHTALVRRVNLERMIAEVAQAAASSGDPRSRDAAVRAWERFGRTPICAVNRTRRSRE